MLNILEFFDCKDIKFITKMKSGQRKKIILIKICVSVKNYFIFASTFNDC